MRDGSLDEGANRSIGGSSGLRRAARAGDSSACDRSGSSLISGRTLGLRRFGALRLGEGSSSTTSSSSTWPRPLSQAAILWARRDKPCPCDTSSPGRPWALRNPRALGSQLGGAALEKPISSPTPAKKSSTRIAPAPSLPTTLASVVLIAQPTIPPPAPAWASASALSPPMSKCNSDRPATNTSSIPMITSQRRSGSVSSRKLPHSSTTPNHPTPRAAGIAPQPKSWRSKAAQLSLTAPDVIERRLKSVITTNTNNPNPTSSRLRGLRRCWMVSRIFGGAVLRRLPAIFAVLGLARAKAAYKPNQRASESGNC